MTQYRVRNNRLYYGNSPAPLLTSEVHIHLDGSLDASEVLDISDRLGTRHYFPKRDINGKRLDYWWKFWNN